MDSNVQGILTVHRLIYPKKNSGGYKAEGGGAKEVFKMEYSITNIYFNFIIEAFLIRMIHFLVLLFIPTLY